MLLKWVFPHFQKNLVTYVTPSIYDSSFYCRIRFYEVVDMVFLNPLSKQCTCSPNIGYFWLYVTNATVTYIMPFFKRLNWNFYFWMFWQFARLISNKNIHVCKNNSKTYMKKISMMKAKHIIIQKSCHCRPDVHFQWERLLCCMKIFCYLTTVRPYIFFGFFILLFFKFILYNLGQLWV